MESAMKIKQNFGFGMIIDEISKLLQVKNKCPYRKKCNDYSEDMFTCNNEFWECGYYKRKKFPKKVVRK